MRTIIFRTIAPYLSALMVLFSDLRAAARP